MRKSIAILGMGRFGQFLTKELSEKNADVLIADSDSRIINQYAPLVSNAVIVDLTDPDAIRNIGLSNIDVAVVAMGSSIEASIMCVMVAKELGIPHVIAKAASERMGDILKRVGADEIIYPEKESATQTARKLMSQNLLEYYPLGDNLCLVNIVPRTEWLGKTLRELRLRNRYHINVVAIRKRGDTNARIDPELMLTPETELIVIAEPKDLSQLTD